MHLHITDDEPIGHYKHERHSVISAFQFHSSQCLPSQSVGFLRPRGMSSSSLSAKTMDESKRTETTQDVAGTITDNGCSLWLPFCRLPHAHARGSCHLRGGNFVVVRSDWLVLGVTFNLCKTVSLAFFNWLLRDEGNGSLYRSKWLNVNAKISKCARLCLIPPQHTMSEKTS